MYSDTFSVVKDFLRVRIQTIPGICVSRLLDIDHNMLRKAEACGMDIKVGDGEDSKKKVCHRAEGGRRRARHEQHALYGPSLSKCFADSHKLININHT